MRGLTYFHLCRQEIVPTDSNYKLQALSTAVKPPESMAAYYGRVTIQKRWFCRSRVRVFIKHQRVHLLLHHDTIRRADGLIVIVAQGIEGLHLLFVHPSHDSLG